MAVKLEVGSENSRTAIFVKRQRAGEDWDGDLCLSVAEAEALLAKLPVVIELAKTYKPLRWDGKGWSR